MSCPPLRRPAPPCAFHLALGRRASSSVESRSWRFHRKGQAATTSVTWLDRAGKALMKKPGLIAKAAAKRVSGQGRARPHWPPARSAPRGGPAPPQGRQKRAPAMIAKDQIGQPQRQAIDQNRPARRADSGGKVKRLLHREPARVAPLAVQGNARPHLVVIGLCRGNIGPARGVLREQALAKRLLPERAPPRTRCSAPQARPLTRQDRTGR